MSDVCGYCNNKLLSPLDAYFCKLYDDYFEEMRGFHANVEFRYEYPLLARVLMKIAYNSARSAGSDPSPLARHRKAILGKEPLSYQVAVFAELISPTEVPDAESSSGIRVVMPAAYRSVITKLLTPHGDLVHTRVVAVNSFYFHLMLPLKEMTDAEFDAAASEFPMYVQGVVRLLPDTEAVHLLSSPQDGIASLAPHVQANSEQYRKFFARRKKSSE